MGKENLNHVLPDIPDDAFTFTRKYAVARTTFDRLTANPGQGQSPANNGLQLITKFGTFESALATGPDTKSM
jgi:hypothetical protein